MNPKYVLAIGMPMARGIQPMTMRCLLAALKNLRDDPYVAVHLFDPVGYQVEHARNIITKEALNGIPDLTHIMWIDDDMTFDPDSVRRLLDHNLPIVGGLCFNRRHPYGPVLVNFTERGFAFDYDYTEGLNQYDATGGAFLLVKKEVFLKVNEKFPNEGPFSITGVGEDVSFCKRATAVGYKIMVDTRIKTGHISPDVVIDEEFVKRNRIFRANPWFPRLPMPKGGPVASIILPTWNSRRDWLAVAVDSALRQTVPVEVIVIDDGSDDPVTMKDLGWIGHVPGIDDHRFDRVRIVRQDHAGCFPALNRGIAEMTTDWFSWLSADDLFYPTKIERQIAAAGFDGISDIDHAAIYHSYDVMVAEGHVHETIFCPLGWKTMEAQRKDLAAGCCINGLTALIHRSVFDNVGRFDTSFTISADWEMWNRIGRDYLWHGINDVLATRREYRNEIMCASQRYANDPAKRAIWQAEDERIKAMYGKGTP